MKTMLLSILLFLTFKIFGQNTIEGIIKNSDTEKPLQGIFVNLENTAIETFTNADGDFTLKNIPNGNYRLILRFTGYKTQIFTIELLGNNIDLETILFHKEITVSFAESSIIITDDELNTDENSSDNVSGLLQASKDIYLKTVAFQFSSSFFNRRGLGSENGTVLINGIAMNKITNGKPQWANWGGLNDVTKNQEFTNGLDPSHVTFGGVLGTTNINVRPSEQVPGTKFTYTSSNKTYTHRFLATHSSNVLKNNWAYTFSLGKRTGKEGFNEASSYNAVSFFLGIDKKLNEKHRINFSFIYALNKRGKSSPNTQEVYDLKGIKYNEYWGDQNNSKRNSRIKTVAEPIVMFNHDWNLNTKTTLQTNIAYQFGSIGNSRLEYTFASNPSPTYYQKLPSYYMTKNDLETAYETRQNFKNDGQLHWKTIYDANRTNLKAGLSAAYILSEDKNDEKQTTVSTILSTKLNEHMTLNAKLEGKQLQSENYARVKDLLGGMGYLDFDRYGNTLAEQQNNLQNPNRIVGLNERFKYNYRLFSSQINSFVQTQFQYRKIDFFLAFNLKRTTYQREGLFENGSFLGALSFGKSEKVTFTNTSFKAGTTYKITGRHFINFNLGFLSKPPNTQNTFANIRENNTIIANLKSKKIRAADFSYIFRGAFLNAKLTAYYTDINDATKISFFYADGISGNGNEDNAFVQEILTNINTKQFGIEFGVEAKITPSLQFNLAGNIGQYTYSNNPNLTLTSDRFSEAFIFEKITHLKNYKLANGPQKAYAVGFEYRDADYWWAGVNANFFQDTYINITPLKRTENFHLDTDGIPFNNYDATTAKTLLQQEKFDDYMVVNLVGGKSYKIGNYYVGIFASIQNILGTIYKTGGFEQSRNANYNTLKNDHANKIPIFGNKYWYGRDTTYFLNINFRI